MKRPPPASRLRRGMGACLALILAMAPARLAAQIGNGMEGEAVFGLSGQPDTRKFEKVQISPVGVNLGFIVQPLFGKRRVSLAEQISFFPVIFYERDVVVTSRSTIPRTNPLIINTLWLRLAAEEPENESTNLGFFAGPGFMWAISTPRDGAKIAPMIGIGWRKWFRRQLGFEVSLQCSVPQIGRTACQLPVVSAWPFKAFKGGGQ
jgi:hypothetical protein